MNYNPNVSPVIKKLWVNLDIERNGVICEHVNVLNGVQRFCSYKAIFKVQQKKTFVQLQAKIRDVVNSKGRPIIGLDDYRLRCSAFS